MIRSHGFTLIELLIVVAIIAILAAIAVPNFLEAQTRAKVSRVRSDHRTIASAFEMYRIDNNKLPPFINVATPLWFSGSPGMFRNLTTPIAYMNSGSSFVDPFRENGVYNDGYKWHTMRMISQDKRWGDYLLPYKGRIQIKEYGMLASGPDRDADDQVGGGRSSIIIYDGTNGTISDGDLWVIDGRLQLDGTNFRDRR